MTPTSFPAHAAALTAAVWGAIVLAVGFPLADLFAAVWAYWRVRRPRSCG